MKHEPNTDATPRRAESRRPRRRWLMRFCAVMLAMLPFVMLELALRTFGEPTDVSDGIDNDPIVDLDQLRPLFVLNQETQRWEIPPSRHNFFRPDSFSARKSANSRRVFVLGGSTVQGRPYALETAFSTWMRLRLQTADSNHEYEVINCGGISYASYRVAKVLQEVLQHQPDAIVLYTGHNEFLEDRTYADVRQMSSVSKLLSRVGAQLRMVGLIRSVFSENPSAESSNRTQLSCEVDARLDHPGGLEAYHRDPFWRRSVESHFRSKLRQMVAAVQAAKVPLVLCVPASDLVNTAPFKTTLASGLSIEERKEFEVHWQRASDPSIGPTERIEAAQECLVLDAEHAGSHFVLGRLLFDRGETQQALQRLTAARDYDVCPLRATTAIVRAVREIAESSELSPIDVPVLFDERNGQGDLISDQIADPTRFVDHLHPSVAGHQVIAEHLSELFEEMGWIQLDKEANAAYENAAKKHLDGLGEAYFARGKQRLAGLRLWASGRAGQLGTRVAEEESEPISTDAE